MSLISTDNVDVKECAYTQKMKLIYFSLNRPLKKAQVNADIASNQIVKIREAMGGFNLYFPMVNKKIRNLKILRDFTGDNVSTLALKYKLSTACIYIIIKRLSNSSISFDVSPLMTESEIFDKNQHVFGRNTREVYKILKNELARHQLDSDLAYQQLIELNRDLGGEQVYIPTGTQLASRTKKYNIWNDYTGSNIFELSEKYNVSMKHVWRVLAHMRELNSK